MRLIDADALKEKLFIEDDNWNPIVTEKEVDEMPTAYDVDKVVEQLEKCSDIMASRVSQNCFEEGECHFGDCTVCVFKKAIEIVKAGGEDDR